MEGYIGEIRFFAGNFAPRNWFFCQGQLLAIASNTAFFSILGTTYGGNGSSTFGLPDFRGRVAVGTSSSGGGISGGVVIGQTGGSETVTLNITQIPSHTHSASAGSGGSGTATLNAVNTSGNTTNPTGNYLAASRSATAAGYIASGTPVAMNSGSISISGITAGAPTINAAGGSQPFSILPPYLGMNYIICAQGIFPSRN